MKSILFLSFSRSNSFLEKSENFFYGARWLERVPFFCLVLNGAKREIIDFALLVFLRRAIRLGCLQNLALLSFFPFVHSSLPNKQDLQSSEEHLMTKVYQKTRK